MDWRANWLAESKSAERQIGVFAFKTVVHLEERPSKFEVHVSADQRYKLLVGDQVVGFGPQRGDVEHWFYDTIDIAPYLESGNNNLWALVWNFGSEAPLAQMSLQFGFLLQAPQGVKLDWQVAKLDTWSFRMTTEDIADCFTAMGPGETYSPTSGSRWTEISSDRSLKWSKPVIVRPASDYGAMYEPYWALLPRSIPPMQYRWRDKTMKRRHGFIGDRAESETNSQKFSTSPLLLDAEELICGFPRFELSGTPGATVTISYAESLMFPEGPSHGRLDKGHRDEVAGKHLRGYKDSVVLGASPVEFEPLWWRTWRYLEISVSGGEAELEKLDVYETGYPYEVEAKFELLNPSPDMAWVKPLWKTGIRTAQRCAGETYFDCPYYEQLQYVGDTRIQALLHYYLSTDRSLTRAAIDSFKWSIKPDGLSQSRYPSRIAQFIPPFSLFWVLMLYDQMMYDRVTQPIDLAKAVVRGWNDMNPDRPFWCFADWVGEWQNGVPPGGKNSLVHQLTLTLAQVAIDLMEGKSPADAAEHLVSYKKSSGFVTSQNGHGQPPSEHAEALYRVAQIMVGLQPEPWPYTEIRAAKAAETTLYFSYYKHLAQSPSEFANSLEPWKKMLDLGLTTFAEVADPTRSDCHAWSAHPLLNLFHLVAGVTSSSPGWRSVNIAPVPGGFGDFEAIIPHPDGSLRVSVQGKELHGKTPVPAKVSWRGKVHQVAPGEFNF